LLTRIEIGKRFVMRAHEKLTAFLELESAIRAVLDSNGGNGSGERRARS